MNTYSHIDTPFNLRYTCWFCGEPSSNLVEFPKTAQAVAKIGHSPIALPACNECARINYSKNLTSIWSVRDQIKHTLIDKYAKHLGIGENWTEQELIDSDFSGSTLGGFGRSAWKMYQIAKQRVDYKGWPLSVDDIPLEVYDETSGFEFDGTRYASINSCIDYFTKAAGVDKELLSQLVDIVSSDRFSYALRIAKLNKNVSIPSARRSSKKCYNKSLNKKRYSLSKPTHCSTQMSKRSAFQVRRLRCSLFNGQ